MDYLVFQEGRLVHSYETESEALSLAGELKSSGDVIIACKLHHISGDPDYPTFAFDNGVLPGSDYPASFGG